MVDAAGRDDATLDLAPMREMLRGRFISLARADLAKALFEACGAVPAHFGVSVTAIDQDRRRRPRHPLGRTAGALRSRGRRRRAALARAGARVRPGSPLREVAGLLRRRLSDPRISSPRRAQLRLAYRPQASSRSRRAPRRRDPGLARVPCGAHRRQFFPKVPPKEALRLAFGGMRWEVPEILDAMIGPTIVISIA